MKTFLPLLRYVLLLGLIILLSIGVRAQTNEGTDFWLGFMEHIDVNANTKVLMIASKEESKVVVDVPGLNWRRSITVSPGAVQLVEMPLGVEHVNSGLANLGIHVTSTTPISVYAHQYANLRSEAAVILPSNSVGNEYRVLTYRGFGGGNLYPSQMMLVAVENRTEISFRPSANTQTGPANQLQTITLNRGETYQVQASEATGDLSGTLVTGDKPFTLMAGAAWTEVPAGCNARDNLYEQMYPLSAWGKRYVLVTFANSSYDLVRVMAAENNTRVFRDGQPTATLNAGEFWEFQLAANSSQFIEATQPIQVAQFIIGNACNSLANGSNGDPSMVLLNPVEQTRGEITLYSSRFENIVENWLNLVIRTADSSTVTLDGITPTFEPVPSKPEYAIARVPVSAGQHAILSEGCGIIATAYGYGNVESYAYAAGATLVPISGYALPEGGCLNDTVFFGEGLDPDRYEARWEFGDGRGSAQLSPAHVYRQLGTYTVTAYLTDRCLDVRDTLTRDILISLRQDLTAFGDTAVCVASTVRMTASDLSGANYFWTGPNNFASEVQTPVLENVSSLDSGTYEVVGVISGCATFPEEVWVNVHPVPNPYLGEDEIICGSGPYMLVPPTGFRTYEWQDGQTTSTYSTVEPGLYRVTVTDDLGCEGNAQKELIEDCPPRIFVPSGFTPNDDGINDQMTFSVGFADAFTLKIFDRWGELVFQTQSLEQVWLGYLPNGALAPEGVYVWVMEFAETTPQEKVFMRRKTGTVTLVR